MQNLEVEIKQSKTYNLIRMQGILKFDNCEEFSYEIEALVDFDKIIIFDLTKLEYMDSSGIGVMFDIVKRLDMNNLHIYAFNLNQKMEQIFKLVKLSDFIKILDADQISKILH